MKLTESQIASREELFYELIEFIVTEHYEFDPDYEITDEDAAITEGVMQYFVEQYKEPSLQENINEAVTGFNINEELYLDIIETILLDESIGSFIAGAVHGAGNFLANQKAAHTSKVLSKSAKASMAAGSKRKRLNLNKAGDSGLMHSLKTTYQNKLADRASKRQSDDTLANQAAHSKMRDKEAMRTGLANKIDTKIADTKEKLKNKGIGFLHKIAGMAGTAMG